MGKQKQEFLEKLHSLQTELQSKSSQASSTTEELTQLWSDLSSS